MAAANNVYAASKTTVPMKIAVLGAAGVGKSAIISQLPQKLFSGLTGEPVEILEHSVFLGQNEDELLCITERDDGCFQAMRRLPMKETDAFILVFSLDDSDSFTTVSLLKEALTRFRSEDTPVIIIGNKSDIDPLKRIAMTKIIKQLAKNEWNTRYIEASAKEESNIGEIVQELLSMQQRETCTSVQLTNRRFTSPLAAFRRWKANFAKRRSSAS